MDQLLIIVEEAAAFLEANWGTVVNALTVIGALYYTVHSKLISASKTIDLSTKTAQLANMANKVETLESDIKAMSTLLQDLGNLTYTAFLNSGIKNKSELSKFWELSVKSEESKDIVTEDNLNSVLSSAISLIKTLSENVSPPTTETTNPYIEVQKETISE
jgi:hypothetical protein